MWLGQSYGSIASKDVRQVVGGRISGIKAAISAVWHILGRLVLMRSAQRHFTLNIPSADGFPTVSEHTCRREGAEKVKNRGALEIIRTVEDFHLPIRQTLTTLGISPQLLPLIRPMVGRLACCACPTVADMRPHMTTPYRRTRSRLIAPIRRQIVNVESKRDATKKLSEMLLSQSADRSPREISITRR